MTSWKITQSSCSREGQHQDGIHAANGVTKGASHANGKVSIADGESRPCEGPEAGMSLPCLQTEGGPWLLEHRGQRKLCKVQGQAGPQRKGGRIRKPYPAALQRSRPGRAPSLSSFTRPTFPGHWASKPLRAPHWADILVCGQGCLLRPRHISAHHILQRPLPTSSSLHCMETLPLAPWLAHGSPGQAFPSLAIATIRQAALRGLPFVRVL